MDFLQVLFNDDALTYEEFMEAVKANNIKLADLSKGEYVSKSKFDDALKAKDDEITTLNGTISTRDTDLQELNAKLSAAGTDVEKLNQLSSEFGALQTKYDNEVKNYKAQLKKQAYEFAVRDFANSKQFSSKAAKRDFISSMISKDLKMDNNTILGAEDFVKAYSVENADAFIPENDYDDYREHSLKPTFVGPTNEQPIEQNGNLFDFNFVGVRPHD